MCIYIFKSNLFSFIYLHYRSYFIPEYINLIFRCDFLFQNFLILWTLGISFYQQKNVKILLQMCSSAWELAWGEGKVTAKVTVFLLAWFFNTGAFECLLHTHP